MPSIIDNQGENTLLRAVENITGGSRELCIASAFFSLDALGMISKNLVDCQSVRILFGDEANRSERAKLLERLRVESDKALVTERANDPTLAALSIVDCLFVQKRVQARCYTRRKFHAKAFLAERTHYPPRMAILGSGNLTRPGLTQNLELNIELAHTQPDELREWFEERWAEAVDDDVTELVHEEIRRQLRLYEPYSIAQRTLLEWGDWVQGRDPLPPLKLLEVLDPHQEDAYRQALKIIDREQGVLICDGVGLGKSFVALALMEHFLSRGKRAFLIAPKAIMTASWEGYLDLYLRRFWLGYSSLAFKPMTWFGYDPTKSDADKLAEIEEYARQAEVVVIDESHNFRKTDANRYVNLLKMLQEGPLGKKTVILLTATPINTEYRDLSAQFRLMTQEHGSLGGVPIVQYQKAAVTLDNERGKKSGAQQELEFENLRPQGLLQRGLEAVAIQRSRRTCKEIARAHGKLLRFPEREPIQTIAYSLSPAYRDMVEFTQREFSELARFLRAYRAEIQRVSKSDAKDKRLKLTLPRRGLRFSAYLPDRYRRSPDESLREAQVESFLVSLVFVNVMKQLESSPVAFQGILQALGAGLSARLKHMADRKQLDAAHVAQVIAQHSKWIDRRLQNPELAVSPESTPSTESTSSTSSTESTETDVDPVAADASGEEMDEWLKRALSVNNVRKGLEKFSAQTHDVETWRTHIEGDLAILRDIHERTMQARLNGVDCKLEEVLKRLGEQRARGRKALVFTQSRRTAEYLEQELSGRFDGEVSRVDTTIQGDRRTRILHSFSPRYNPMLQPPLDYTPVNILVSTDVLSEGVNLQEAGCILNYDIHWNPVRLIQRIGRVDRRLREDDPGHTFGIFNVEPPPEIEAIIDLVGTVEDRKRKITGMLGLDQSFFRADDPEGTLKEFNAQLEGEVTARDTALEAYDELIMQRAKDVEKLEAMPPGALGVWEGAPQDGLFALFEVAWRKPENPPRDWKPEDTIPEADLKRFGVLIGSPQLVLSVPGGAVQTDAPTILELLKGGKPEVKTGSPSDAAGLRAGLKKLKSVALGLIPDRTQCVTVELVCWMEMRR